MFFKIKTVLLKFEFVIIFALNGIESLELM